MADAESAPALVGIGAIFIDDIVLPDGQTYMGRLGGGVTHAVMGAVVWSQRPGIVALIGRGLPEAAGVMLHRHLDTRGLFHIDLPQARAWQVFEHDGTRRELYRSDPIMPFIVGARPEHFPDEYGSAKAFYLLQGFEGIAAWAQSLSGIILWEPLQQIMVSGNRNRLRHALQSTPVDLVSPNLKEARAVYGDLTPEQLVQEILEDGARAVALRMGPQGSLLGDTTGLMIRIPAVTAAHIVDQTGAGNTYCGALLAGLSEGKSLGEAGAMGTVAASFCVEQVGVLDPVSVNPTERDQRLLDLLRATQGWSYSS